jgi:outer membrane protein
MKSNRIFVIALLMGCCCSQAQEKWNLERCINYSLENSLSVKQALLTLEGDKVRLQSAKMQFAPTIYGSAGQSFDFGRAATASALIMDNYSQASTSLGVNLNMPLFQGLKNYRNIKSQQLNLRAGAFDVEQTKENITFSVIACYLQVLLCKEIHEIAQQQVQLSQRQVIRIESLLTNGKSAESELYNAKAILASDQLTVTQNLNNYKLALLDLAQLMNVEDVLKFEVEAPSEAEINTWFDKIVDIETIIVQGILNRPVMKAAQLRMEQGIQEMKSSRSGWYPSLNLSIGYGTSYYFAFQNTSVPNLSFLTQLKNHSSEFISLSLSVPIFDRLSTYHNVNLSKINQLSLQNSLEDNRRELTKAIYQAYYNSNAAKENLNAAKQSVEATQLAFQHEELKYNEGKSTAYQYSEAKNKYQEAQSQIVRAKYEYALRVQILEYYGK